MRNVWSAAVLPDTFTLPHKVFEGTREGISRGVEAGGSPAEVGSALPTARPPPFRVVRPLVALLRVGWQPYTSRSLKRGVDPREARCGRAGYAGAGQWKNVPRCNQ